MGYVDGHNFAPPGNSPCHWCPVLIAAYCGHLTDARPFLAGWSNFGRLVETLVWAAILEREKLLQCRNFRRFYLLSEMQGNRI
jgi:hypothetical protein